MGHEKVPNQIDVLLKPPNPKSNYISFINYSIIEFISNLILIICGASYLFSCSAYKPLGLPSFSLKIKPDSMFAKNIVQAVQEGLKFVTYLSNDLNIYINETILDSNLQVVDSLFDNSEYYFNVFGFCRKDQFGEKVGCFVGEGVNIVASFIQDFGHQLGNLTKQPDPRVTSNRCVSVYYTAIDQLCSGSGGGGGSGVGGDVLGGVNADICKLRIYNQASVDLQYIGVFNLLCSGLIIFLLLGEFAMGYCIIYHGKFQIKWRFAIKLVCLICSFLSLQVLYFVNISMQIPLRDLLVEYQIATLQFYRFNFIAWNIVFLLNLICTVEMNITKMGLIL